MSSQFSTYVVMLRAHPMLAAIGGLSASAVLIAYLDYRAYIALGPHGLPDTFWGWRKQLQMTRKARKDTTVPAPYDLDSVAGPHDKTSFLTAVFPAGLGARPGNKVPVVPGFVAPQRQTSDQASGKMKKAMFAYLEDLVSVNNSVLQTQMSVLEGPVPALGMKNFKSVLEVKKIKVLAATRGEMCHVHPPDGSTHLILSLADQKQLIELGWARRHRLSGGGLLPWNYTFIYAPRDEQEFEMWKKIVVAATTFYCVDVAQISAV